MDTKEIKITEMEFVTGGASINITCTNPGTTAVTIGVIKVNDASVTVAGTTTVAAGGETELELTQAWTAGNKYSVAVFTTDGTLVGSYTDTA